MTDEMGVRTGIYGGFGCSCEDQVTMIGLKYNRQDSTLSFYKNGFLQGIAFKGVPEDYVVSLDLWFDSGSVEIMHVSKPKMKKFL